MINICGEFDENDDYNDSDKREIWNRNKPGTQVTDSQLKSGNVLGSLFSYSSTNLATNPAYCWIYQAGELPKLYWE